MKYNKGMATSMILLIVAGALVIGGVSYYAGKKANSKKSLDTALVPVDTTLSNNEKVQSSKQQAVKKNLAVCEASSTPSITILSPKGGESYSPGQQVTVSWKGCNLPPASNIMMSLDGYESMNSNFKWNAKTSAGSYVWTVPNMSAYNRANYSLTFNVYMPGFVGAVGQSGLFAIN